MLFMNMRFLRSKVLWLVIALLLLAWLGWGFYKNSQFRLINTVPSMSAVPAEIREIDFNYNRPLSDQGLSVTDSSSIIRSKSIDGKKLVLKLGPLAVNQSYTITVQSIQSKDGGQIHNAVYKFKAKNISYQDMPADVQKLVLDAQQQNKGIYSFNFSNIKTLTDFGLPGANMTSVQKLIYRFAQSLQPPVNSAVIDSASVATPPRDPNNPPSSFSMSFNVAFGGVQYKAKVSYTNDNDTQLRLYDSKTSAIVFDSSNLPN